MSRARRTVRELAQEAGLDYEMTLMLLNDVGILVRVPGDSVPRSKNALARQALDLPPIHETRGVPWLARRAGITEDEARQRLRNAGFRFSRREARIPRNRMARAEQALGLQFRTSEASQVVPPAEAPAAPSAKQGRRAAERERKRLRSLFTWQIIGKEEELSFLEASEVEAIHWVLVKDFRRTRDPVEPPGVRDTTLLESAVFRARTSWEGVDKYPTAAMCGAALLHSLVLNHPFFNGNKRTALVTTLVFLDKNGYLLQASEEELYDFVLAVADHRITEADGSRDQIADREVQEIARWIQGHIRRVRKGEFPLRFRQLREVLLSFDCKIEFSTDGNKVNIARGPLKTQIHYWDEGREVPINTIHRVRRELRLDDKHGVDSAMFYDAEARIPDFIARYRKVLDRLAKV